MLHIYYGNGSGKTTAAAGLVLRQINNNQKVMWLTFLKDDNSGEIKILKKLNVKTITQVLPLTIVDLNDPDCIKELTESTNNLFDKYDSSYDCLVFDELLDAIQLHLINEDKVYQVIKKLKDNHEIIMTGRLPTQKFKILSDYSTEMKKHKHPFDKKIPSRKGVEF